MSIRLDNVSCLLYLSIREKLLDHERITKDGTLEMMVDYPGVNSTDVMAELDRTRGLMLGLNS